MAHLEDSLNEISKSFLLLFFKKEELPVAKSSKVVLKNAAILFASAGNDDRQLILPRSRCAHHKFLGVMPSVARAAWLASMPAKPAR